MKPNKQKYSDGWHELQLLISKGDEEAFELLYSYYHKRLLSFAKNFLKSKELSEEIVEDVFVKLWCKRENLVNIQNLNVYLYSATKNHALNALSKEARRLVTQTIELSDHDAFPESSSPHDLLVSSEIMQSMNAAIELLPKRCKLIFQLVREDGLRYKEVSEILNISVNTIDAQMAIAVKRLCAALGVDKGTKTLV